MSIPAVYVYERCVTLIQGSLVDDTTAVIPTSDIGMLTLTLYSMYTPDNQIINNRYHQNVKNANDVALDANGNFQWLMQAVDNIIVDPEIFLEHHQALFEWTFGTDTPRPGRMLIDIWVRNLIHVPQLAPTLLKSVR